MFAIIRSGGHQYRVAQGEIVDVQQLSADEGDQVDLGEVLAVFGGDQPLVGCPVVDGAVVRATVLGAATGPKLTVFKYKPKNRYRIKTGHRQHLTRVRIDAIELPDRKG